LSECLAEEADGVGEGGGRRDEDEGAVGVADFDTSTYG